MAAYQPMTSPRTTAPDVAAMLASLRASVASDVGVQVVDPQHYVLKKSTAWQAGDISSAQTIVDTTPALTPQREAQNQIDAWPLALKALVLALIDQLNVIRAALPVPLPPITPGQALAAIRTKAGTL